MTNRIQRVAGPIGQVLCAGAFAAAGVLAGGCHEHVDRGPSAPSNLDERQAAFPLNDEDLAKIGYRRDWLGFPAVAPGGRIVNINAGKDVVYVQDSNSTVTALEASNGQRRWTDQLSTQLTRFVALAPFNNRLLACADFEVVGMRTDNGDVLTRQRYSRVVNTAPVIVGDRAIFGTASGEVIAHGLGLGFQEWAFGTGFSISRNPVAVAGSVAVVNDRGELFFLDPLNGAVMGRSRAMYAGTATNPIAAGDLLVVASLDQSIYAFKPGSERPVWQYRCSSKPMAQPAYHNGLVICEVEGSLKAFDATNGAPRWTAEGTTGEVVAIRQGRLVVKSGSSLILMDAARGDVLERIAMPGMLRVATDGAADSNLYVVSTTGLVAKLLPR